MKRILFATIALLCFVIGYAQKMGYDSEMKISNGLYAVKSGEHYGVVDKNGNVVVSIEYQKISFREGKALLTKDDILYGVVDKYGNVKNFKPKYKVHPNFRYVYEDYIIVGDKSKWGYVSVNGEPLRFKSKIKGMLTFGKKSPTMFDEVYPFEGGCAVVYLKRSGWKQIDRTGAERFVLGDKKKKAMFRSSVYNGECIIVTDDGIKLYQEDKSYKAVVKRVLSTSATYLDFTPNEYASKLVFKEGVLTLDSLMRVSKYESNTESMVFIEKQKKVVIPKIEPQKEKYVLKKAIRAKLKSTSLQANENGNTYTDVIIENISNIDSDELIVRVECAGSIKEWSGIVGGKSQIKIPIQISARFSALSIRREVLVRIQDYNDALEVHLPVTIKRYTPTRRR